ncbi:MAG: XRE family transcriptional regulator [bacterium]
MSTAKSHSQDFAAKIKKLRKKGSITLETLAAKTGQTVDFLEKIENGEVTPPVSVIIQISNALTVDSGAFLSATDDSKKRKAESFNKRKNAYLYKTLTPDAELRHMKGFNVTIPPESEHEGVQYKHAGEEFIYVLEGRLDIEVGSRKHSLKKSQSLHFDSGLVHKLRNPGKKTADLLVIVYTP